MWKRLTQAAVSLAFIVIGMALFFNLNGTIAFADVLEYIQQRSYTFDMTVRVDNASSSLRGRVLQPGHMRFDTAAGIGKMSTIIDLESRTSLVLIHAYKTAKYVDIETEYSHQGIDDLLSLCSLPVENLWNIQDRSAENLGEKVLDDVTVQGYRVAQDDAYFSNEITLWANARSGRPISVEIVSTALKPPYGEITWQLNDFDLDIELDPSIFSVEVPPGYTLTDQTSVQDIAFPENSSAEAQKIAQAIELWQNGQEAKATNLLMQIDWNKPIVFAKEPYALTLTEKELVLLKQTEREALMPAIMNFCATLRKISFELSRLSQEAQSAQDYAKAETYLKTSWHLGEVIGSGREDVLIVRLTGIALRKKSLGELKALYEQTDEQSKLIDIHQKLQIVDTQHQTLSEQLKQQQ